MDAGTRGSLELVVGVAAGGLNGIDAYAEAVADAAAAAGHRVVLLATGDAVAAALRRRADPAVEVVSLGLPPPTGASRLADRLSYRVQVGRVARALGPVLARLGRRFDVAHLARPPLAAAARPFARRVVVAAWFHPHALGGRVEETWRHTRGPLASRLLLTGKSVGYYLGDARGYRDADLVVAPTRRLSLQLGELGIRAAACPPPVRRAVRDRPAARDAQGPDAPRHLLVVSGDLTHPRKHVDAAVGALAELAAEGREVTLHAIGRRGEALLRRAPALPPGAALVVEGPRTRAEVRVAMAAADVLVLPSRYEEWGYVAVEALLEGTPVATFPVYPFAEMLAGDLGAVAAGPGPVALAGAVAKLLDRPRPADLVDRAAARFGAEAVGRRLTTLWHQVLARGGALPVAPGTRLAPTGSPPPPP